MKALHVPSVSIIPMLTFAALLLWSAQTAIAQFPASPIEHGGGEFIPAESAECLSDTERQDIEEHIRQNRRYLIEQGRLKPRADRSSTVLFEWPVLKDPEASGYNDIWVINYFVDHGEGSAIQDWNCGQRSYDGHKGTDIVLWPFPWFAYEQEYALAVAAASGTIVYKQDGNEDDHCSCSCSNCWNAVYLEHADGSVSFYGHLKLGSLTPKAVGETVVTGEYLGAIASSGCSTIPHLHFEVYRDMPYIAENLIDPFAGPCNDLNTETWWADPLNYREPRINALFTHDAVPVHGCPDINEHPHFENVFIPGETVYTAVYLRDQLAGSSASYELLRPNGSVYTDWTQNYSNTYTSSWWYWSWILPTEGPFGTWTVTATYQGETVSHPFLYVEVPPAPGMIGVNTTAPQSELHVHDGALYIDNASKGIILKGENGSCYRLKVNSSGTLVTELLTGCPD